VLQDQTKKIRKEDSVTNGKDFQRTQKAELAKLRSRKIAVETVRKYVQEKVLVSVLSSQLQLSNLSPPF
jgi:hypothetical protein